ncbi:hypothetical protein MLD38_028048 [Melastoma candidum]|uniref:Uncharacterized protein n=1 Tax=Melastoma candidum TaxID=119954 RepID=A0ACB9N001_9MYRT|nr:hypothetical protein MLD38_028048 [Melastoma candidum]
MGFSPEAVPVSPSTPPPPPSRHVSAIPALLPHAQCSDQVAARSSDHILGCLRLTDATGNDGTEMMMTTATAMTWKQVEERFHRVAYPRHGVPGGRVARCSDFAYCIGMEQSKEFGKELLRAIRGHGHGDLGDFKCDINLEQLHFYWDLITTPCSKTKLHILFHMYDRNMDGIVTTCDMKQMILLSAATNKLAVTHEEAQDYAHLVMDAVDSDNKGFLHLREVEALLKIGLSKDSYSVGRFRRTVGSQPHGEYGWDIDQEPMSRPEAVFRAQWRRAWIVMLWIAVCCSLFAWKFVQYRRRMAFEVMGYCLCTAKGAAETLKFNMAVILLPVCRNTITWLRSSHLISSVFPFNDNINFHKLIAAGIVIGVILHGGTHLACDFPRISGSDRSIFQQTIAARFGYRQPSYIQILATTEVTTGIVMVILMTIAFSLATTWPRRQSPHLPTAVRQVTGYNTFWYSHHLFILVYVLLIIHSMFLFLTSNMIEKTTWMYIAVPVLLYAGERILRSVRSGLQGVEITKATIYPGKVLSIEFRKPEGFEYRSGMCIYLQCPQVSPFEWHPFSLTSGPDDDCLSIHIRTLGDWSRQLYSLFQETKISRKDHYPEIRVDGPYGAASQDHVKYEIVVMIGLGIGITPFISILKDVTNNNHHQQNREDGHVRRKPSSRRSKAYLYWVTREQSSFAWFRDVIEQLPATHHKEARVEMHNFLTCMYKEEDARTALLSAIQVLCHARSRIDFISRTPVCTDFGRPDWHRIFSELSTRHRGKQIGVFYCGPSAVARELQELSTKFTTTTTTTFVFHKEHY